MTIQHLQMSFCLCLFFSEFEMKQEVFDGGAPTPVSLYQFLQTRGILTLLPSEDEADVYLPWAESEDYKVIRRIKQPIKCNLLL